MIKAGILTVSLAICISTQVGFAQDVSANATRPSASDNAYLTARGFTEIEIGWLKNKNLWSAPALLKLGIQENLEIGFAMSGIVDQPVGGTADVGTPGAQLKVKMTDQTWGAIAAAVKMDWPSGSAPSYTFYPVASFQTEPLQIDVTVGGNYTNPGSGYAGTLFYATAFSPKLGGNIGVYGEVFGSIATGVSAHSIDFGVSYAASPRFIVDASAGFGITADADSWVVQVGFTSTLFKLLP